MDRWWKWALIIIHCLFQSLSVCVGYRAAPVFNLVVCRWGEWLLHSQDGCDVKAQGDGDVVELSAADASNPDKAKSANSVSLILVYICLPVPAVQPCPHHHDRAWWRRNCRNSSTLQQTPLLSLTPSPWGQARESRSPSAVIRAHPRHPTAPSPKSDFPSLPPPIETLPQFLHLCCSPIWAPL